MRHLIGSENGYRMTVIFKLGTLAVNGDCQVEIASVFERTVDQFYSVPFQLLFAATNALDVKHGSKQRFIG